MKNVLALFAFLFTVQAYGIVCRTNTHTAFATFTDHLELDIEEMTFYAHTYGVAVSNEPIEGKIVEMVVDQESKTVLVDLEANDGSSFSLLINKNKYAKTSDRLGPSLQFIPMNYKYCSGVKF